MARSGGSAVSRASASERELRNWGQCSGQETLFGEEDTLTPEIQQWRNQRSNEE